MKIIFFFLSSCQQTSCKSKGMKNLYNAVVTQNFLSQHRYYQNYGTDMQSMSFSEATSIMNIMRILYIQNSKIIMVF